MSFLDIQNRRLDLTKTTNYMGPRRLIKEGFLMKHKSGRRLCAFLCNDMLILTDEGVNRLYKMVQSSFFDTLSVGSRTEFQIANSTGPSRCEGAFVERSETVLIGTAKANDSHLDSGTDDLAFQLVFSYPRGGETLVFKTSSARDCDTWIKAISSASRRARDIRVRASRKTR